jgi:hypothetical protein
LEKEAREEFEAAIAAKNSSEEEEEVVEATSAPVEDQESSINSQSEWRMRSWTDDDDDDDLVMDYSPLQVMTTLPSNTCCPKEEEPEGNSWQGPCLLSLSTQQTLKHLGYQLYIVCT